MLRNIIFWLLAPLCLFGFIDKDILEKKTKSGWVLYDKNRVYYNLDNETLADYNSVVDDPFLIIRTKCNGPKDPYNLLTSWYNYTRFSPFEALPDSQIIQNEEPTKIQTESYETAVSFIFDHQSPSFEIDLPSEATNVWWQISLTPSFNRLLPNCDQIDSKRDKITFDPITETFFSNNRRYFFRFKSKQNNRWGEWSEPYQFQFLRPEPPSHITFDKEERGRYTLSWKKPQKSNLQFWVFASNALDFIPSIYSNVQINAASQDSALAEENNDNCVAVTADNMIMIDGTFAFYRIVAESDGCFSTPSTLIRIYDEELTHQRTVLQQAPSPIPGFAKRVLFPSDEPKEKLELPTLQANVKPAVVDEGVWDRVKPYLMPLNHPIRGQLDRLFSSKRVLQSRDTILSAGFNNSKPGLFSKAIVAEHSKIKGYIFKMFSDSQANLIDWEQWLRRCSGARSVRASIREMGLTEHLVAPHKWIYPLPPTPHAAPGTYQKYFICVAEKIPLYKKKKSYKKWRNMSKERLKAVFLMIQKEGLTDSNRAFNVPFAKDGRNAFIDLEHNHDWPVHFDSLKKWLSSSNSAYLDTLKTNYIK